MNIVYELHKVVKASGTKSWFLITAAMILILFLPIAGSAQDPHGSLGYYQPPPDCIQCHAPLLVENHQDNCWVCHNTDYSLKICTPLSYPPDLNFTTVCANYQTSIKEPFSCGDCHVQAGDHTIAHDQTLLPSIDCSQCHIADAPSEHSKYNLSCTVCHNSTNTSVQNAISRGKSGIPVYCTDCHGLIDHQVHKNTYLPLTDCSVCHLTNLGLQADIVNEHAKKNFDCNTCHNSNNPTIQAAINRGIAGNSVYCADCHTEFSNHARMHDHTILTSAACGTCHAANAVSEHQGHGHHGIGCLPCHTNADTRILTAIYGGMSGQNISCDDCHLISGNRPPIANCGADKVVSTGLETQFSGSSSYDHDGTIGHYEWDFGDSTPKVNGMTVSHTYATTGIYQVNLVVTDNQGAIDTDTSAITVRTASVGIEQVWTTDLSNVVKTTFRPGEAIRYHVRFATGGGTFFTKASGTTINTTGTYWKQTFLKKETIAEGIYHWQWDKAIPLVATPGSKAKIKFVVKIFNKPAGTLLATSKSAVTFKIQ